MLEKPKYCSEKWTDLVPMEGGSKCLKCEKILKDFSKKSFSEIEKIQSSESGPHCGIYSKRQIKYWNQEKPPVPFSMGKKRITKMAMLTSMLLSLNPTKASAGIDIPQIKSYQEIDILEKYTIPQHFNQVSEKDSLVIEGFVIDSVTQDGLVGVGVSITSLNKGAYTDNEGKFRIVIENVGEISFPLNIESRYLGYETKNLKVKNDRNNYVLIEMNPAELHTTEFYITKPSGIWVFWWKVKSVFRRKNRR